MGEVNEDQVSVSALLSYEKCPSEYEKQYIQLRKKSGAKSGALGFGSQWHDWYEARLGGPEFVEKDWPDEKSAFMFQGMTCALEESMADAWLTSGGVWAVEIPFEVPIFHPVLGHEFEYKPDNEEGVKLKLVGRIDAVWRDNNGDDWIVEHKTTGATSISAGSAYWEERRSSLQGGIYAYACACLGLKAKGVIYNVARKPRLRPKRDESMEEYATRVAVECTEKHGEYFASQEVMFTQREMTDAMTDVWEKLKLIEFSHSRQYWPRSFGACMKFNSKCEYYYVCRGLERLEGDGYEDRQGRGIPKEDVARTSDAIHRVDGGRGTPQRGV